MINQQGQRMAWQKWPTGWRRRSLGDCVKYFSFVERATSRDLNLWGHKILTYILYILYIYHETYRTKTTRLMCQKSILYSKAIFWPQNCSLEGNTRPSAMLLNCANVVTCKKIQRTLLSMCDWFHYEHGPTELKVFPSFSLNELCYVVRI